MRRRGLGNISEASLSSPPLGALRTGAVLRETRCFPVVLSHRSGCSDWSRIRSPVMHAVGMSLAHSIDQAKSDPRRAASLVRKRLSGRCVIARGTGTGIICRRPVLVRTTPHWSGACFRSAGRVLRRIRCVAADTCLPRLAVARIRITWNISRTMVIRWRQVGVQIRSYHPGLGGRRQEKRRRVQDRAYRH
jgi:hypothetical protein